VNVTELEQVTQYKYLDTIIAADGRCDREVKTRIVLAKKVVCQHKVLLKDMKYYVLWNEYLPNACCF